MSALMLVLLLLSAQAPSSATAAGAVALTDAEVQEAIRLGRAGLALPTRLYFAPGVDPDKGVTAVAYSPMVRIGMAAAAARQRNLPFEVSDVPERWRHREVYVALRSLVHPTYPEASLHDRRSTVLLVRDGVVPRSDSVSPSWVSRDPRAVLAAFGAELPYPDIAVVASFPQRVLDVGWCVVGLLRDVNEPQRVHTWAARLTREDLQALKR